MKYSMNQSDGGNRWHSGLVRDINIPSRGTGAKRRVGS